MSSFVENTLFFCAGLALGAFLYGVSHTAVVEPIVRVDRVFRPAQQVRMWQCTKNEFTEYRIACASRERMGRIKPKE